MPVSMTLATDRPDSELYRVLVDEPFPAINTTDAFLVDKRTKELLEQIWKTLGVEEDYGIELVVTGKDEKWGMKK